MGPETLSIPESIESHADLGIGVEALAERLANARSRKVLRADVLVVIYRVKTSLNGPRYFRSADQSVIANTISAK